MPYFDFTRPTALLLLLLLVPIYYWNKKSIADMPEIRRKVVYVLRILITIALIFSIAGFRLKVPRKNLSVLFLVDTSLSISRENRQWALDLIKEKVDAMPADDEAGVILFGKDSFLEESLSPRLRIHKFSSITTPTYTNVGRAIQMASAIFPEHSVKRIILITDGNENLGDAQKEALLASSRGIEIETLPYPEKSFPEVLVNRVEAPAAVVENAPFALKIDVESGKDTEGVISVYRDGSSKPIAKQAVDVRAGKNMFMVTQQLDKSGNYRYRVQIETKDDRFPHNNAGETVVSVKGPPRVLYLSSDPRQLNIMESVLSGQKFEVLTGGAESIPTDLAGMSTYKAVIFDNVNGLLLSPGQMQMIENYVKDLGGGFIMVGGDKSFGAGGYYKSPVERILPVDLDIRKRKTLPSIAMILCIDKSSSMSGPKIQLARESAIATVELLNSKDKLGIIAFDGVAKWISKLGELGDKFRVIGEIASIRAGGGTNIYPSLVRAHETLVKTNAMIKHVIVLTDGRSAPGDFEGITKKLLADKITLSSVGVGTDADTPFLEELAKMGQGRFYYTDEASLLPRIFVREAILVGRSAISEKPFFPVSLMPTEFLRGINEEKMPMLLGHIVTAPKERAHTTIATKDGDPVLAYWRTGLGKSVAFTSDDGLRWAKDWTTWEGFRPFWLQTVRWVLPNVEDERFTVTTDVKAGSGKIAVEALDDDGLPINFLNLKTKVVAPSGESRDVTLRQTSSGRYEADFSAEEVGTYFVNVVQESRGTSTPGRIQTFTVPYSPEYKKFSNNMYLIEKIASITGGSVITANADVFKKGDKIVYFPREMWKNLLIFALLLFPFDVALRRVYMPEGFYDRIRNIFTGKKTPVYEPGKSSVEALKARKDEMRDKLSPEREPVIKPASSLVAKAKEKQKKDRIAEDKKGKSYDPFKTVGPKKARDDKAKKAKKEKPADLSTLKKLKRFKKDVSKKIENRD